MSKITLVTAFFNIGRENFKAIPRTNNIYFQNFKFWCRLKNDLIVYTDPLFEDEIYKIREEFGLRERTHVIPIKEIDKIEPEILSRMFEISKNTWFERFRILPNATSNIPTYSYLMLLKTWFIKDAVEKGFTKGSDFVSWIDFGFNHGGSLYTHPEDFNFEWKYDFSNKIHLFYYEELDKKPIYETVRRLADSIMGCIYILPVNFANELWNLTKNAMQHLNAVDLYDDDQLILLMAYRANPRIFEMHESKWFLPLKEYGGSQLRTKQTKSVHKIIMLKNKIKTRYKKVKLAWRAACITYKDLLKKN